MYGQPDGRSQRLPWREEEKHDGIPSVTAIQQMAQAIRQKEDDIREPDRLEPTKRHSEDAGPASHETILLPIASSGYWK